jgi:BolA protein
MPTANTIADKLNAALTPATLDIIDESSQHAGHVGARPEGETHFRLKIVSDTFTGKSRVERQRLVYQTLADELAGGVHALAMVTLTPAEDLAANS